MRSNIYKNIYNNGNNEKPKDIIVRNLVSLVKQINESVQEESKVISKKIRAIPRDKTNK